MWVNKQQYEEITKKLSEKKAVLVAVSKLKPVAALQELYALGQRDFGENYVQELLEKQPLMPPDVRWHFIGHLQTNKVKYLAPFVYLIQGVDSLKLLKEINKQAAKCERRIRVLLQVHIAQEATKFGFDAAELETIFGENAAAIGALENVCIVGFMGMATFTDDAEQLRQEYKTLKNLFEKYSALSTANCQLQTLSMGMSGDYELALEEGSTMVRIGSRIFGARS